MQHLPNPDIHPVLDFCLNCGHHHNSITYHDKPKQRHCSIEGCRCLARNFISRALKRKM